MKEYRVVKDNRRESFEDALNTLARENFTVSKFTVAEDYFAIMEREVPEPPANETSQADLSATERGSVRPTIRQLQV